MSVSDVTGRFKPSCRRVAHVSAAGSNGAGGGFGDCRGFAPEKLIYRGTLSDFTRRYRSAEVGLETFVARASPTTSTFKFTVSMDDQDATPGESASADFVWHSSR